MRWLLLLALASAAQAATPVAWDADPYPSLRAELANVAAARIQGAPRVSLAQAPDESRARALFSRPLIIGASVSAGARAESPGHLLARRFGGTARTHAWPGATGAALLTGLADADMRGASAVVGLDLFFWDARRDCGQGLAAVDAFFARAAAAPVPVIVGNIPPLGMLAAPPDASACRERLNAAIAAACASSSGCVLLDLAAFYAEAAASGVVLDGRRLGLRELLPDGLHPNADGSRAIAQRLLRALTSAQR